MSSQPRSSRVSPFSFSAASQAARMRSWGSSSARHSRDRLSSDPRSSGLAESSAAQTRLAAPVTTASVPVRIAFTLATAVSRNDKYRAWGLSVRLKQRKCGVEQRHARARTKRNGPPRRAARLFGPIDRVYSMIFETTPEPTVRPPSRMAKRRLSSIAIGAISSTSNFRLSPGITISVPAGSATVPVTSVVRK